MSGKQCLVTWLRRRGRLVTCPQARLVSMLRPAGCDAGPEASPPSPPYGSEPGVTAATSSAYRGQLPLAVPIYSVWGANTNVGKTLVSVGLAYAAAALQVPLSYVKPVQTGFPADSDARLVALSCGGHLEHGPHAEQAAVQATNPTSSDPPGTATAPPSPSSPLAPPVAGAGPPPRCTTLFAWRHAVSPHLAVKLEGRPVSDEELVAATSLHVRQSVYELMDELRRGGQHQRPQQPLEDGGGGASGWSAAAAAGGGGGAAAAGAGSAPLEQATAPGRTTTATGVAAAPEPGCEAGFGSTGGLLLVETAGGVTSPAPSGRLACDVLRPLRLPAVLVGDPRLGGIAATLSAYDSLMSRGWDVEAVVLVGQHSAQQVSDAVTNAASVDGGGSGGGSTVPLDNLTFLREHFSGAAAAVHRLGAPPPEVVGLPACPPPPPGHDVRRDGLDPSLRAWLPSALPAFATLLEALQRRHQQRLARLLAGRAAAEAHLWWPFTQHAGLTHGSATLVDGRCGQTWTALAPAPAPGGAAAAAAALVPLYDASGSWWTQAATPALQPAIAQAVSYAAGRYLHVLFAEVAHEPALRAAEALLRGPGAGWAARVFFSDDGSTAVEVALKMAFRKFLADRGELGGAGGGGGGGGTGASGSGGSGSGELMVLGLQGAYHGDTLGAQDCVAPSVFNGPLQAPWYRGRGLFLEPPYVGMKQGRWRILDPPAWLVRQFDGKLPTWASLDEMLYGSDSGGGSAFQAPRAPAASTTLTAAYVSYINGAVDAFEASGSAAAGGRSDGAAGASGGNGRLAACIMEPLLQGAGGMLVVEPGFQRAMAEVCRTRRLPLILDEVFSGLFRTGALTAASALGITPDIACYGKLLTGGAAPMAVTLASREVFEAFNGPSKLFALLHGHSYTAYPIGCAAATASLELLTNPDTNPNVCAPCRCPKTPACAAPCGRLLPMWDEQAVSELSYHPLVTRVAAVGTVLAVELAVAAPGSGTSSSTTPAYGSVSAVHVVRRLRDEHGIYARPLGPVVYLMVPPTSRRQTAAWLAGCLRGVLDSCAAEATGPAGPPEESVVV